MVDLEIREIMDMCCDARSDGHELITFQQQAVSALNRGKAADVYGLKAEHFLHGGDGSLKLQRILSMGCISLASCRVT